MDGTPNTYGKPSPAYYDSPYGGPATGMMGGQMGSIGMANLGALGINPNTFYFFGSCQSLRARIQALSDAEV